MNDPLAECRDADGKLDLEKVKGWETRMRDAEEAAAGDVAILRESLLAVQVCARKELSPEAVTEIVNQVHPAGTTHGWSMDDSVNPVVCGQDTGRIHYVLTC